MSAVEVPDAVRTAARELAACYGVIDFDGLSDHEQRLWFDLFWKMGA